MYVPKLMYNILDKCVPFGGCSSHSSISSDRERVVTLFWWPRVEALLIFRIISFPVCVHLLICLFLHEATTNSLCLIIDNSDFSPTVKFKERIDKISRNNLYLLVQQKKGKNYFIVVSCVSTQFPNFCTIIGYFIEFYGCSWQASF